MRGGHREGEARHVSTAIRPRRPARGDVRYNQTLSRARIWKITRLHGAVLCWENDQPHPTVFGGSTAHVLGKPGQHRRRSGETPSGPYDDSKGAIQGQPPHPPSGMRLP